MFQTMFQTEIMRRAGVTGLVALALLLATGAVIAADAKDPQAESTVSALPEPLTHESVRELVSRLSDEQVRQLLIDRLDRSAAAPAKVKDGKGMSGMVEQNAGMVRERLGEFQDAIVALPATLREVVAKLDDPAGPSALPRVGALLLGVLVFGWLAERMYDFALRHYRKRLAPPSAETFTARSFRLEISADPELSPSLLQPLKMGGVMSTEDSAIVVRAKFTARPEGEPYMIQKAAYSKILKAFREAGIKFAHKQVTVYVPPSQDDDATKTAMAGAAALAAQPAGTRG